MATIGNTPENYNFIAASEQFSGNGVNQVFTIARRVTSANDIIATVENVVQDPFTAYTLAANTDSGTADVTFTSAPPAGSGNIVIRYNNAHLVAYNIVTGQQIQANSISATKIADSAVTADKLADTTVTPGTYGGAENIPVIVVDQQGRLTSAANVSVQAPLPNILMLSGM